MSAVVITADNICGHSTVRIASSMLGRALLRPTSLALRPSRLLHSSVPTANYVGPPDPMSNIRPVLYNDLSSTTAESSKHPYSLDEFHNDSEDTLEYQWKLQQQQLDAFNDAFWRDVCFLTTIVPPVTYNHHSHIDEHSLRSGQSNCRTTRRASRRIL